MVGLGDLPGGPFNSAALAASGDGSVIVGQSNSGQDPGFGEAFRWTEDTGMEGLGHLSGQFPWSEALGVSADGAVIVGFSGNATRQAFRWTADTGMVALATLFQSLANGVSADGRVIVGRDASRAVLWDETLVEEILLDDVGNPVFGSAFAASADGSVIVGAADRVISSPNFEAFRWTRLGGAIQLGTLPPEIAGNVPVQSRAIAVSADGSVVVGDSAEGEPVPGGITNIRNRAFIWDAVNGLRDLRTVLVNDFGLGDELAGWTLTQAVSVSTDGKTIVGNGINPLGDSEAWMFRLVERTQVAVDILPGSCVNPFNVSAKGVLPVAILGTGAFDVTQVDVATVTLQGVSPLRSALEDVGAVLDCSGSVGDGFIDLTLKFDRQAVVAALGSVEEGDLVTVPISGKLRDGTVLEGQDVIAIKQKK
jgi:probable HAF family extracellular repeat protein